MQWAHPSDILSVALILGGDIVESALAQLTGDWLTPVPFWFGWMVYSVNALRSAIGEKKLMPQPDCPAIVINAKSHHVRQNQSWILGRILRDFNHWKPQQVIDRERVVLHELAEQEKRRKISEPVKRKSHIAISVSVFKASQTRGPGKPTHDWVYFTGLGTMLVHFGVVSIPCALYQDWAVILTTVLGSLFALAYGALPAWKEEKFGACGKGASKTIVMTRGNGSPNVIVIRGIG
jgi:hypothetical protein